MTKQVQTFREKLGKRQKIKREKENRKWCGINPSLTTSLIRSSQYLVNFFLLS